MSNETTSSGESVTQTPDTPVMGTPAPGSVTPQKSTLTLEEALKRIADLEHERGNAREAEDRLGKKLAAYEKKEKEALAAKKADEEAQLSELERTNKRYSELQSTHDAYVQATQERLIRYEVERQAAKMNIIDPDAAARLLDWSKLEYNEDGTPKNADKLLEQLVKHKPYLVPAPAEPAPETPTHATVTGRPPALPAMNPQMSGRTSIPSPGVTPPGKIPRLSDPGVLVPPGTVSKYQP